MDNNDEVPALGIRFGYLDESLDITWSAVDDFQLIYERTDILQSPATAKRLRYIVPDRL
ncbi:MAG: hypothetical protein HY885_06710 [Deltaproteobacteria bacterium]|nr:hypothetical protein [Deltaproteobacteria bacterium]